MNGTHSHGSCSFLKQLIVNRIIESCKNMVSSIETMWLGPEGQLSEDGLGINLINIDCYLGEPLD